MRKGVEKNSLRETKVREETERSSMQEAWKRTFNKIAEDNTPLL